MIEDLSKRIVFQEIIPLRSFETTSARLGLIGNPVSYFFNSRMLPIKYKFQRRSTQPVKEELLYEKEKERRVAWKLDESIYLENVVRMENL